jgi:hypothetical protein
MTTATQYDRNEAIRRAFHGSYMPDHRMDVQAGHLWDSCKFRKGEHLASRYEFFSNPRDKTLIETNVRTYRRLDAPESFSIARVLFTFSNTSRPEDIFGVAESFVWSLWLGHKRYLSSPIISLQTATQPVAPIRICTYCQAVYVQDRDCPGCGARDFRLSEVGEQTGLVFFLDLHEHEYLIIDNQLSFYVQLDGDGWTFRDDFKMWVHFEGLHARGVQ